MAATGGVPATGSDNGPTSQPSAPRGRGDGHRGRGQGRGGRNRGRGDGRADGRGGGGRGGRGRGRGNFTGGLTNPNPESPATQPGDEAGASGSAPQPATIPSFKSRQEPAAEGEDGEAEVCFICANPISHISIAPCNHATCHICALRLRALYKDKNCPHCRTEAPFVIFTDDNAKRFGDYTATDITSTDDNIGIKYANEDIVGDTVLLLRYNCPDDSCDFAGLGWPDLHRHVRSVHHKKMCDLCTRNKKVFTHEHELFADKELEKHMRKGDDMPGAVDQTGFKGHPLCGFCGERFYDGDKLYEHCRNKHERCFICDRRDSRQPHYYQDYNALEKHFQKDHFLCLDRECLEKKFVVFETEIDLKAHQLSEHGNSLSKDVRRDARLVDMSGFDLRTPYHPERRGGHGGGGSSSREQRGRGRDPNSEPLPASSAQPMRRDELAFQRQMAIHSAQSVSTRTFGGQLSNSSAPAAAPRPNTPSASTNPARNANTQQLVDVMENISISDLSSLPPEQRARLTRHGAVIERATNLLGSDSTKVSAFRSHISSYNKGTLTAPQLIDAFFALFADTSSTALGTLVREVADLFEDRPKGDALLRAWQNWRAINEDYPSLPGLGGMHGATTASSGWASAASASPAAANSASTAAAQKKASNRVLRLKNSTRRGSSGGIGIAAASSNAGSSSSSSAPAFSRAVAPSSAPPSNSAFPALPGAKPATQAPRTGASSISYASPTLSSSRSGTPGAPASTAYRRPAAPAVAGNSRDAFPSLPPAPKPLTTIFGYGTGAVRRDVGGNKNTGFSWGGGSSAAQGTSGGQGDHADADNETGGKGKKKKKQILAQWG